MPSVNRHKGLVASAARTVSGSSEWFDNNNGEAAMFFLRCTAASGTNPTLNVKLQVEDPENGAAIDLGLVIPQLTAAGSSVVSLLPLASFLPKRFRFYWTIAGTTPSFTFSIGADIRNGA